jgi:hypothetical protein
MDRTVKIILIAIALGLWMNAGVALFKPTPAFAQPNGPIDVHIVGGRLDYETDVNGGPTLKVCTQC